MKGDAVTPQILFLYVEFLGGGKWEKHFPVLFSGNMAQLRISRTFDISYQTRGGGGRISRHPRYGKAEVLTLGNLYVNELVTCDFKSSSPVTVSLL